MKPAFDSFPVPLLALNETNSTNSYLREYCKCQPTAPFTTVLTSFQTAGRGQRGNTWESDAEKNLLFSFVLFPDFLEVRRQFLLSQIVSLAIKETLDCYTEDISIKWPNDIYWQEKKICGILIENDWSGNCLCQSIAGIGLNINQQEFHSPAPNPVSLLQITGHEHELLPLLAQVMTKVKDYYQLLLSGGAASVALRYREALFRKEGWHPYIDAAGSFEAEIVCVEPEGNLVLKDRAGNERTYAFKEVQYAL
ncbi:MAG: biotin--[acetyl-CoA-carboxylase] ligase [Bacteroides sp.]